MTQAHLEQKISNQKRELTQLRQVLEEKNKQLDTMAWVWCNGGCPGGIFRYTDVELTEEIVLQAERNVQRMRTWLHNHEFREKWQKMTPEEKESWFEEKRKNV